MGCNCEARCRAFGAANVARLTGTTPVSDLDLGASVTLSGVLVESTREIEAMIGSIQQGTRQTADALLTSADQSRQTQEQAKAANKVLGTITQAVSGIDERNMVIASAAEEQAQVAREVDRNLVRIRDLSIQTSAGSEQTHAASQELSRLAGDLSGLVRRFKV